MTTAKTAPCLPAEGTQDPGCDSAKRQQILEGARRMFLEHGFDGASIGDIVRAAGVSKGTVYAYFDSKEKLFEALIIEDRRRQSEQFLVLDENDADVAGVLHKLGTGLLGMMVQPYTRAQIRMVIAASGKFPALGRAFYEAGPQCGTGRLAAYLTAQVQAGHLAIPDVTQAARQFLELCKAGILLPMLLGVMDECPPERIEVNVDQAVRVFLAAYQVKP